MTVTLHQGDIPADLLFKESVAVDAEMMGLKPIRDRLCLVQLSSGDGTAHLVQFKKGAGYNAPNLKKLLTDPKVTKILHFARADIASFYVHLNILMTPVYCTKIASRLTRTFTDHHGLKNLCRDILGVDLDKQQQITDWGVDALTPEQITYAASDVLHLHKLRAKLDETLEREGRTALAKACFDFVPHRAVLDTMGWDEIDILAHS